MELTNSFAAGRALFGSRGGGAILVEICMRSGLAGDVAKRFIGILRGPKHNCTPTGAAVRTYSIRIVSIGFSSRRGFGQLDTGKNFLPPAPPSIEGRSFRELGSGEYKGADRRRVAVIRIVNNSLRKPSSRRRLFAQTKPSSDCRATRRCWRASRAASARENSPGNAADSRCRGRRSSAAGGFLGRIQDLAVGLVHVFDGITGADPVRQIVLD